MFRNKRTLRNTLALAIIGLVVTMLIAYVERSATSIYQKNLPLKHAGEYGKELNAKAYINLNELVAGNREIDFNRDVQRPITRCKEILNGVLRGQETERGKFELVTDEALIQELKAGLTHLETWESATKVRWESARQATANANDSIRGLLTVDPSVKQARDAFDNVQNSMDQFISAVNDRITEDARYQNILSWISIALVGVIFTTLCIQLYRRDKKSETRNNENQAKLDQEAKRVSSMSTFIEAVSAGNYDIELNNDAEDDDLLQTLVNMRNKLRQNAEDDRKRNWATSGLAQFGEILRTNTASISELYDNIVRFVVKYTGSTQGGLFLLNDDDERHLFLELVACYAFERKKFLKKNIGIGEGLVSQCYLERERIYMMQVPQDYVNITSGLGGVAANAMLLVPLKVNDKIFGVIEIGSLKKYEDYEIDLVEKLAESMAATISTVKINDSTRILLEKSQQQAEEMKAQEEEMRQNMEELSATQEEMSRKNAEAEKLLSKSFKKEEALKLKLEEFERVKKAEESKRQ